MPGTGPQRYPGASTAYYYQNRFGGDLMEVNVVVLHTTEGATLPDYGGGAVAPNLTAVPDFAAKKLKWFQHFDIDRSSRALVNLAGGVETNTNNVCQVELTGTCDPATHKKWTAAGQAHIYWPEAPDWALRDLADFLAWMHVQHGVPLVGPAKWPAYPSSYGNGAGQRMTGAQWNAFKGVCGHMHVTENDHGDPGAIDFTTLIALAKGDVPQEDDMEPRDVWAYKNTGIGETRDVYAVLRGTNADVKTLADKVAALDAKVGALAVGGVDLDALAERVADKLAARLAE